MRASGPRFLVMSQNDSATKGTKELHLALSMSNCFCIFCAFVYRLIEGFPARKPRGAAQVFLDAQELVVLRRSIRPRQRSGFDLTRIRCHGEIGNKRILGFAGTMRDDRRVMMSLRELD